MVLVEAVVKAKRIMHNKYSHTQAKAKSSHLCIPLVYHLTQKPSHSFLFKDREADQPM